MNATIESTVFNFYHLRIFLQIASFHETRNSLTRTLCTHMQTGRTDVEEKSERSKQTIGRQKSRETGFLFRCAARTRKYILVCARVALNSALEYHLQARILAYVSDALILSNNCNNYNQNLFRNIALYIIIFVIIFLRIYYNCTILFICL